MTLPYCDFVCVFLFRIITNTKKKTTILRFKSLIEQEKWCLNEHFRGRDLFLNTILSPSPQLGIHLSLSIVLIQGGNQVYISLVTKALILQLVKHKLNFMHVSHPINISISQRLGGSVPKTETTMNELHFRVAEWEKWRCWNTNPHYKIGLGSTHLILKPNQTKQTNKKHPTKQQTKPNPQREANSLPWGKRKKNKKKNQSHKSWCH